MTMQAMAQRRTGRTSKNPLRGGEMSRVVALVEDIFFLAKMKETAKQTGVTLETAGTPAALAAAARVDATSLLIVDLNARGSIEAIEMLHAAGNTLPVIAFFSHVQAELAERARVAGCEQVMPRSKFSRELAEILTTANVK
jgi:DNA-binding NarL/FixJ family response regulator